MTYCFRDNKEDWLLIIFVTGLSISCYPLRIFVELKEAKGIASSLLLLLLLLLLLRENNRLISPDLTPSETITSTLYQEVNVKQIAFNIVTNYH